MPRRTSTVPPALARAQFPEPVLDVLRALDAAGHRSWLVGGAVRDRLLRRERIASDHDVATPARPEEVARLFPKVIPTGIEHGTVTVLSRGVPVEVTTFRGEGAYVDGRRPSSVTFLDDVDADLARRDFTVNALAYDPIGREFRDPHGGREDLRRHVLRAVGDPSARFAEDGLRPVRAVRFAAQLGFALDAATAAAIRPALAVTARVSAERIAEELSRLLTARRAERGLELLDETGLLAVVLPDVEALEPAERAHAFAVAAAAAPELTARLAGLLHAFALRDPTVAAADRAREVLQRMRFSTAVSEGVAWAVLHHGCLLTAGRPPPPAAPADVRRWLARVGRARAPSVLALWEVDARALRPAARSAAARRALGTFRASLARVERERPPVTPGELALDGRAVVAQLRTPPGPVVGEALRHLLDRVLEEPSLNTPERLASELQAWWGRREG